MKLTQLGSYVIQSELGAGAMGKVYLARDTRLDREVAIKVLWPHLAEQATYVERFRREARAAAGIDHPNVVRVHDVGTTDGYLYMAMEYVRGRSLRELLADGPLAVPQALRLFRELLAGLTAAHELGLLHRDLKPGNVLIEQGSERVKLVDFGLVKLLDEESGLTGSGELIGTIEYLAPEYICGQPADRRADYYAAGVILYRALTGRLPFDGETPAAIIEAHQRGSYRAASALRPKLPPAADAVIAKLLARDPSDRYPDAESIIEDLDRWARGEPVTPGVLTGPTAIDEGLERHPIVWWRSLWYRMATWFRYQYLELTDRTEPTVVWVRDAVCKVETEHAAACRRLKEGVLLRDRLRQRLAAARNESARAAAAAGEKMQAGDEPGARAALAAKLAGEERGRALESELGETEKLVVAATRDYTALAAAVAAIRHRADLLLARRHRARLELSLLGMVPAAQRRSAERALALLKLLGLLLLAGALFWSGYYAGCRLLVVRTRDVVVQKERERLEQDWRMAAYLAEIPLGAPIVFVDAHGNATGNGSEEHPFPTINQGVAAVPAGGIVLVRPGEYRETVRIGKSIHLIGSGPDKTTLVAQPHAPMLVLGATTTVAGFFFANPEDAGWAKGIILEGANRERHRIHHNVFRNTVNGIDCGNSNARPLIAHNVFYDNFYAMTSNRTWRPIVVNNILYRNTHTVGTNGRLEAPDQLADGADTVIISHNLVSAFVQDYGFFELTGAGAIAASPKFVDPGKNDFHLLAGSPCIDAGDPDFDRLGRYLGSHADLGAWEFDPSQPGDTGPPPPPGVLIDEVTGYFMIPHDGPVTDLVPVNPATVRHHDAPGQAMGGVSFDGPRVLRAPNRLEKVILLRTAADSPAGYAALRFSLQGFSVRPSDVLADTAWHLELAAPRNAICDGITIRVLSGAELEIPDRLPLDCARTEHPPRIPGPTVVEQRSSALSFSNGDNGRSLALKLARLTMSDSLVFTGATRPLPLAEASLHFAAATVVPDHLDRAFYLEAGDVVFEIKIVDYLVSIFHAGDPDLLSTVTARRRFNRPGFLAYFGSIAFRVRTYYRGDDRSVSYSGRAQEAP